MQTFGSTVPNSLIISFRSFWMSSLFLGQLSKFELSPSLRPLRFRQLPSQGLVSDSDWFQSDYEEELLRLGPNAHFGHVETESMATSSELLTSDINLLPLVVECNWNFRNSFVWLWGIGKQLYFTSMLRPSLVFGVFFSIWKCTIKNLCLQLLLEYLYHSFKMAQTWQVKPCFWIACRVEIV